MKGGYMIKEFICDYCGKTFLRDTNVNKSQNNKHNYCCREHYLEVAKKNLPGLAKSREIGAKVSAEANRGLPSRNIRGKQTKEDRKMQEKIMQQIMQEMRVEMIPHLKEVFEKEKKEVVGDITKQYGASSTSVETLEILIKVSKGIIKRLDDMWKQVDIVESEDKMKRYKEWFIKPYVDVVAEIRKTAIALEEMRVGKKFVVEHTQKKSIDEWLVDAKLIEIVKEDEQKEDKQVDST